MRINNNKKATKLPHTCDNNSQCWPNNKGIICENTSICWVYCVIFPPILSFISFTLHFSLSTVFDLLFAFHSIFFDFLMITKTSNTWTRFFISRSLSIILSLTFALVCLIHQIRFIIAYPVLSRFLSAYFFSAIIPSILLLHRHHYRLRFSSISNCVLSRSLFLFFLLFIIAILFDIKLWICAVSFVYNGITLWSTIRLH